MKSLFVGKTQSATIQFFRYLFVGGIAALADSGSLYLLVSGFGVHHLAAGAIGFLIGLVVNYTISIAWVFQSKGSLSQEFPLFAVIGIGGLLLTEVILWASVDLADWPVLTGKCVALVLVFVWNFGMRRRFVFGASRL